MTPDLHHIHIIGRYRQGQHTLMTSRSQGQSQGHQGHFRFFANFVRFRRFPVETVGGDRFLAKNRPKTAMTSVTLILTL